MSKRAVLSLVAALVMMVSAAGGALADPNQAVVSLTITPGSEFSVVVTSSMNFPNKPFSLTTAPANYDGNAAFNYTVTDMRGTGVGWSVTASSNGFSPNIPSAGLPSGNNYCNGNWSGPQVCASAGSIIQGVSVPSHGANLITTPTIIIKSAAGQTSAPSPYGTGAFSTQEAVFFTGLPVALTAQTYTTTITLTLAGTAP